MLRASMLMRGARAARAVGLAPSGLRRIATGSTPRPAAAPAPAASARPAAPTASAAAGGGAAAGAGSSSSAAAAGAARPRAVGATLTGRRGRGFWTKTFAGGVVIFAGLIGYQNDFSWDRLVNRVKDTLAALQERKVGDPHVEDLQAALGPPPPPNYVNVIIGMEEVLLRREWDRRYGWVVEPRPGVKELLRALTDPNAGVFVTLWSSHAGDAAATLTNKLSEEIGGPPAHTSPLSVEHMFIREGGQRKEKRLEYFNRDPKSILLIDADSLSALLNPKCTVLVEPMSKVAGAAAAGRPTADITCAAIRALVMRVRDDAQAGGVADVPRSLARLRAEAESAGFPSDATGMYRFLLEEAAREEEAARQRREAGLGGLMRRTAASSSVLRNRATTMEAAAQRPFTDPTAELGEDSILAKRMRELNSKLFRPPGAGPA